MCLAGKGNAVFLGNGANLSNGKIIVFCNIFYYLCSYGKITADISIEGVESNS